MSEKKAIPSEHVEQRDFVQWFRRTQINVRIFAIPNGGHRSPSQACRLKVEGVSPGVPDLFVPEWLLWVEMKRKKKGKVSLEQLSWMEYLKSIGHTVIVAKCAEDAIYQTEEFLKIRGKK
jgi:VRR-NUC domain